MPVGPSSLFGVSARARSRPSDGHRDAEHRGSLLERAEDTRGHGGPGEAAAREPELRHGSEDFTGAEVTAVLAGDDLTDLLDGRYGGR